MYKKKFDNSHTQYLKIKVKNKRMRSVGHHGIGWKDW